MGGERRFVLAEGQTPSVWECMAEGPPCGPMDPHKWCSWKRECSCKADARPVTISPYMGGWVVDRVPDPRCPVHPQPQCDGMCVMGYDVLSPGDGVPASVLNSVAYPHPGCPLHAPEQVCGCDTAPRSACRPPTTT